MNRGVSVLSMSVAFGLFAASDVAGQQRTIEPDPGAVEVFNRRVTGLTDGARKGLHLNESPGDGVAYVRGVELANGTIEFDARGRDVQGQSFIGVAFYGVDSTTYDAIYFRPFNFRTEDTARRLRAVQYISHPTFTWNKLRAEHPGMYEQPVDPAPDPNGWFHVRVVLAGPRVSVYVGDATKPSLVVKRLSERTQGRVGLWVGNNSAGDFANLTIRPSS